MAENGNTSRSAGGAGGAGSRKKTATKKPAASTKKTIRKPAGQGSSQEGSGAKRSGDSQNGRAPRAQARPPARASQVAAAAASELLQLTGKQAEGVTGLERTEDGWTVQVEVVEVRRIPDTTDVLALYEVTTDDHGGLLGYRRVRRYARGVPGED